MGSSFRLYARAVTRCSWLFVLLSLAGLYFLQTWNIPVDYKKESAFPDVSSNQISLIFYKEKAANFV